MQPYTPQRTPYGNSSRPQQAAVSSGVVPRTQNNGMGSNMQTRPQANQRFGGQKQAGGQPTYGMPSRMPGTQANNLYGGQKQAGGQPTSGSPGNGQAQWQMGADQFRQNNPQYGQGTSQQQPGATQDGSTVAPYLQQKGHQQQQGDRYQQFIDRYGQSPMTMGPENLAYGEAQRAFMSTGQWGDYTNRNYPGPPQQGGGQPTPTVGPGPNQQLTPAGWEGPSLEYLQSEANQSTPYELAMQNRLRQNGQMTPAQPRPTVGPGPQMPQYGGPSGVPDAHNLQPPHPGPTNGPVNVQSGMPEPSPMYSGQYMQQAQNLAAAQGVPAMSDLRNAYGRPGMASSSPMQQTLMGGAAGQMMAQGAGQANQLGQQMQFANANQNLAMQQQRDQAGQAWGGLMNQNQAFNQQLGLQQQNNMYGYLQNAYGGLM